MRFQPFAVTVAALTTLAATPAGAAVLVQYNFSGNAGTEASEPASFVAPNLGGLAVTRGPGLTPTAGSNSLNSSGFSTDATADFLSFGLTVNSGFNATVNQLIFGSQASNTGPGTISVLASVDNGAFTQVGSFSQPAGALSQTLALANPLTALNRIEFRFVAANTTSANGGTLAGTGTFRLTNFQPTGANTPFTIDGSVARITTAVPEPATWAMMIAGFGLVGGTLRRRRAVVRLA
jgi:hypothetical protein